ncbi:MAG: alanine--tRNA ligase, partial [Actinomycetota bacterium]|nr:alanine--tRNA ligase [Actinomycetota bacterium]
MDANALRRAFTAFFAERGHTPVPSSSLIPHDKTVLFTVAGMVQFKPYFLGVEPAPHPRAVTVQKCMRAGGKHNDLDAIGTTTRHLTFFEMLGNFSFGDYFKADAIPFAWDLVTNVFGFDPERLWITCHTTDDEAADIWRDAVGVPAERIQRMGADNWWQMADTGLCGPCSEIYFDRGPEFGDEGGPAGGGGEERYIEFWNLVFMQFDRRPDGTDIELPKKNIDTGAGLERIVALSEGTTSVFETDVLRPIVAAGERATGRRYGDDEQADVSLRILADHARAMTFLVSDGVLPSNEDRDYVLRRIIRRAVRHAFQLGADKLVTPALVEATVDTMGEAYPELVRNADLVGGIVTREEERFRQTLKAGSAILDEQLAAGVSVVPGEVAFKLHDTFGFPIELTEEIAQERGVAVDRAGFGAAMEEQRRRGKEDRKAAGEAGDDRTEDYRSILDGFGPTEFTGYQEYESKARVLAVLPAGDDGKVEVFLDRTPFYAEGGGQVGDTGSIATDTGRARVLDTTAALPGLHRHVAVVEEGEVTSGQEATASIDVERREAIRRNHTGTHLLHWALREVLGPHVKQQGSLVAPDYLRFDFSHHAAVTEEELELVEQMANERILADEPVRAYETSKEHAEQLGAIAFFGDKYGETVRIVEAGTRSMELCGGTHVSALGMIGPIKVTSEGSIGSNMRRVFALTGTGTLRHMHEQEQLLERAADLLRAKPEELPDAVQRTLAKQKALEDELKALRSQLARGEARGLAEAAVDGQVVARRDGLGPDQLRELALAVRDEPGVKAVVLIGTPDGERVSLVAAVAKDSGLQAGSLVAEGAKAVGGGGGGKG